VWLSLALCSRAGDGHLRFFADMPGAAKLFLHLFRGNEKLGKQVFTFITTSTVYLRGEVETVAVKERKILMMSMFYTRTWSRSI
jgi:hypothetical protein